MSDNEEENFYSKVSLHALSNQTLNALDIRLEPQKVLLSSLGYERDWKGLATIAGLNIERIKNYSSSASKTKQVISEWKNSKGTTVKDLITALEKIERFDVLQDVLPLIDYDLRLIDDGEFNPVIPVRDDSDNDILTIGDQRNKAAGKPLEEYDAFVLYADADHGFVINLLDKLEGNRKLKLCLKDRDLIGGALELDTLIRLFKRCNRIIIILSNAFIHSPMNQFLTSYATSFSIEQRSRLLLPVMIESCEKPKVIAMCHSLDIFRTFSEGLSWNYWDKLYHSVNTRVDLQIERCTYHTSSLSINSNRSDEKNRPVKKYFRIFSGKKSSKSTSDENIRKSFDSLESHLLNNNTLESATKLDPTSESSEVLIKEESSILKKKTKCNGLMDKIKKKVKLPS